MRKVVFVIDGWFMRKRIYRLKSFLYDGPNIRKYCKKHLRNDDTLYRIFYYDTEPLNKKGHNPVSGNPIDFGQTKVAITQNRLLDSIRKTPNFALRLGSSIWHNGWILKTDKLKQMINNKIGIQDLTEYDVKPNIIQKTVDMKIGLDIAFMATKKVADLLIIITGDQDIVPALKFARREGMQVGLDPLKQSVSPALSEHVDFLESKL